MAAWRWALAIALWVFGTLGWLYATRAILARRLARRLAGRRPCHPCPPTGPGAEGYGTLPEPECMRGAADGPAGESRHR